MNRKIIERFRFILNYFKKKEEKPVEVKVESEPGVEKWDNKAQFILSLIGLSVGLGNVWRFPAIAYNNGGGAFLIPYVVMYMCVGFPMYYLELALGQFIGKGASHTFTMAPMWKGLGWSVILMSSITSLYYNVISAWIFHFLFGSFRRKLIWDQCTNPWNDDSCIDRDTVLGVETYSLKNNVSVVYCNNTNNPIDDCIKGVFATSQYFYQYVLNISDSIENFGTPSWSLVLCLLLAWVIVVFCLSFGLKSSGKVVYFTAVFPYVVLVILLIRGVTLQGSSKGIIYFLKADFSKIFILRTWYQATSQVLFSLGMAYGCIITYSSYNDFHNNFLKDTLAVTVADCFTSIIGGFVLFSILGFMSHTNNVPIDKLVSRGTGLAFIIYPEILAKMPAGPFFSIMFFFMLFTLALDSQFGMVEALIKALQDTFHFPNKYRLLVTVIISSISFLLGITMCCPGGFYLFEILNTYSSGQALIFLTFCEVAIVAYIYGFNNFMEDIKMMLNKRTLEPYLLVTWCFLTPISLIVIIIIMSIEDEPITVYGNVLPEWTGVIGWLIVVILIIPIPIGAILEIYRAWKNRQELSRPDMPSYISIFKFLNTPSNDWKPLESKNQIGRYSKQSLERRWALYNVSNPAFELENDPIRL